MNKGYYGWQNDFLDPEPPEPTRGGLPGTKLYIFIDESDNQTLSEDSYGGYDEAIARSRELAEEYETVVQIYSHTYTAHPPNNHLQPTAQAEDVDESVQS